MAQIVCRDLALGYEGNVIAEKLNFEAHSGDYLCIVGENGSGKSTLMKTLLGLIPPLGGSVGFGDGLLSREIGYLPQQTTLQRDFPASVYEVVISGALNGCGRRIFYSADMRKRAYENMERLGISHLAKKSYRELSGGQQQRVLLARALMATSKLLLLDEPVSGLDPNAASQMYDIIEDLNKKSGITVIMISHDVSASLGYATHILHIKDKATHFFGSKDEYIGSGFGAAFLGGGTRD